MSASSCILNHKDYFHINCGEFEVVSNLLQPQEPQDQTNRSKEAGFQSLAELQVPALVWVQGPDELFLRVQV